MGDFFDLKHILAKTYFLFSTLPGIYAVDSIKGVPYLLGLDGDDDKHVASAAALFPFLLLCRVTAAAVPIAASFVFRLSVPLRTSRSQ